MADIIYPYKKYNYKVLLDNSEEAGFSEVSSPDITSDPVEYREGNMTGKTAGKQPGILKYGNVTLKRGVTESQVFVAWMKDIQDGKAPRKTVVITLMDDEMNEVASWQLEKAWPTKYTGTDMNATSNEVAIESLELVTEGVTRIK
ncbi:phage tail protein [Pseudoflavonifractor capillosus]|uniref:phage tail protein n=1 Tax=Pseudoflavonifractor capillosus TaxID=106588 RepID=UPI00195B65F4|nr:phage tail protein [Pseudoflavonifractor capillosus]MBM6679162.1 phage tail protein [Pseudoflavonifractor capillosus]